MNGEVFLETASRQSFHGFFYDDYVGIHLTLQKGQSEEEFLAKILYCILLCEPEDPTKI